MAHLNITYNGLSADCHLELDSHASDRDVKRIAVEMIRSGSVPGLVLHSLPADTFDHYVVDRLGKNDQRLYLRPKVPFGAL
jgi:hypothetical protein